MRPLRPLALGAILLTALPASAQDAFPDVPRDHWAYAALLRMRKDGLLVGYPDGLYRGGRPMSRYELAVALHAAYTNLKNRADSVDVLVHSSPKAVLDDLTTIQATKDYLEAIQTDLLALKGVGADLADLQRGFDTFELELNQLGVDTQAEKDELRSLVGWVRNLEARKEPLEIGGEIQFWAGGGHTDGDHFGLTRDGRLTGTKDKGPNPTIASRAGITDDLALLGEAAFEFKTTNETGLKVAGTLVATNAFGQNPVDGLVTTHVGFGNQSDVFNPTGGFARYGYAEGSGDVYLQGLVLSGRARGFDLEAGRLEAKATPWILRRIDNTLYFDDERWDSGGYTFDGLRAATHLGPIDALAYAGVDQERSVKGVRIDTIRTGAVGGPFGPNGALDARLEAGRILGATLSTYVKGVGLRGDWLVLDADEAADTTLGALGQLQVVGGEAEGRLGRLRLEGGLRGTQGREGGGRLDGTAGNAWDAKAAYASGRFDGWLQYRQVQTNYLAPGDWGRLGVLRDPTNIRGFLGDARIALAPRLVLDAEGEISHGLSDSGAAGTHFDRGTDIGRYALRLDVDLRQGWTGYVRYEQTLFHDLADAAVAGDPRYQWYGVGVARALSPNARFTLAYEQSAIRHDYQTSVGESYRGGFLTSQVTVKF